MSAAGSLFSPEISHALQKGLDRYLGECQKNIETVLGERLSFQECLRIQKNHLIKDLIRNPINAAWSIPYLSIRKVMETSEKLGWETGKSVFSRIPQAFKTDFQKEVERIISQDLFGLTPAGSRLEKILAGEPGLKAALSRSQWDLLVQTSHRQILQLVSEYCAKQNGFTDLAASAGLLLIADLSFGDRTLDIFGLGRKMATLWAKKEAVAHFAFGKTLGRAFYSLAPPPAPTAWQVAGATMIGLVLMSVFATAVGTFSYPIQQKLGFRRKQIETLVDSVHDKLLVELTKKLKAV